MTDEQALDLVDKIFDYYKENAKPHQRIGAMIEKMNFDDFKSKILGE